MSFYGEETWQLTYPVTTPTVTYTVPILRCSVKSKSKAEIFRIYDVEKQLYVNKYGNRWEYEITIVNPVQSDIDSLEEMNGKLVEFQPHIENPEKYECWLWYWYDDSTPHKDRIYVNLIRKTLEVLN